MTSNFCSTIEQSAVNWFTPLYLSDRWHLPVSFSQIELKSNTQNSSELSPRVGIRRPVKEIGECSFKKFSSKTGLQASHRKHETGNFRWPESHHLRCRTFALVENFEQQELCGRQ